MSRETLVRRRAQSVSRVDAYNRRYAAEARPGPGAVTSEAVARRRERSEFTAKTLRARFARRDVIARIAAQRGAR